MPLISEETPNASLLATLVEMSTLYIHPVDSQIVNHPMVSKATPVLKLLLTG